MDPVLWLFVGGTIAVVGMGAITFGVTWWSERRGRAK
jgi:hypothetical protein